MKTEITTEQALAKLKTVANDYDNMSGIEITEEDAENVIRAMNNKSISLDDAANEIIQGILYCLCLNIE